MPEYLPTGLMQFLVQSMCSTNSNKDPLPYHVTRDEVSSPLQQRLEVDKITGHQPVRG